MITLFTANPQPTVEEGEQPPAPGWGEGGLGTMGAGVRCSPKQSGVLKGIQFQQDCWEVR